MEHFCCLSYRLDGTHLARHHEAFLKLPQLLNKFFSVKCSLGPPLPGEHAPGLPGLTLGPHLERTIRQCQSTHSHHPPNENIMSSGGRLVGVFD